MANATNNPVELPSLIVGTFDFGNDPNEFVSLATTTLGNAADSSDGFHNIFDPMANGYPGDDIGSQKLNEHIAALEDTGANLQTDPDPTFSDTQIAAQSWADQNISDLTGVANASFPVQPVTQPNPEDVLPPPEDTVKIILEDGSELDELPANWIQIADDGTITWQAGEQAPEPIELDVDVDRQGFQLMHTERSGSDRPEWITSGHFYEFVLKAHGVIIAAKDLNTVDNSTVPQPENATLITSTYSVKQPDGTTKQVTVTTPPAALLAVAATIKVWSTTAGLKSGDINAILKEVGLPVGVHWEPRVTQTENGPSVIFIPVDENGNNVSGIYGTVTPAQAPNALGGTGTAPPSLPDFIPVIPGQTSAPADGYAAVYKDGKLVGWQKAE